MLSLENTERAASRRPLALCCSPPRPGVCMHLLFPLPGSFFPQVPPLSPVLPTFAQRSASQGGLFVTRFQVPFLG